MATVIVGISTTTHTLHVLHRASTSWKFIVIDPKHSSNEKKKPEKYTLVDTLGEAADKIRKGFYARMRNIDEPKHPPDIIAPAAIRIFEVTE